MNLGGTVIPKHMLITSLPPKMTKEQKLYTDCQKEKNSVCIFSLTKQKDIFINEQTSHYIVMTAILDVGQIHHKQFFDLRLIQTFSTKFGFIWSEKIFTELGKFIEIYV